MDANIWVTILQLFGAIIALVIVHELGHFIAARLFGVEVEEFGIGFPPRVATLFEAGGTKFTLNAIPLGGFVRPKGENDPTVEGGLAAASPWVRIIVLASGPIANLLVAVLLYAVIFSQMGIPDTSQVEVVGVLPDSPAFSAGLMTGDRIIEADGDVIESREQLHDIIYSNLGEPIEMVYQRQGETGTISLTPRVNPPPNEGSIGIIMGNPTRQASIIETIPFGFRATYLHSRALLQIPIQLIRGQADPNEGRLVGFKGMFDIYQEVREEDAQPQTPVAVNTLAFFTQITVSLGLFNLVPFPALDGGRILFALPEIIIGRRVPPEYENWINLIGFGLLLMLLIYINLQDFISPVLGP